MMTRRTWLMMGLAVTLTLAVVGGVWAVSAFTGSGSRAGDCCLDPTCPPGCSLACPPNCAEPAKNPESQSCCPGNECCPDSPGDSICPADVRKTPSEKGQYKCPPCPLCPGW
jgi:hypothetical protein